MDETSASFLDKTDWRTTLHRKLEDCVNAEGTEYYPRRVKSLMSAFSGEYPGWNAKKELNDKVRELETYYATLWNEWIEENSTAHKGDKQRQYKQLYMNRHHDIFEFIKNRCDNKRMTLWGTRRTPGGTQIPYTDTGEEITKEKAREYVEGS